MNGLNFLDFSSQGLAGIRNTRSLARYLQLVILAASLVGTVRAAAPVVSNIRAAQRPGTHLVDIFYNVFDPDGNSPLTIYVAVSENGGATFNVPVFTLSGAVGPGVLPGNDRQIVWNAGTDWPGRFGGQCKVKITADDSIKPPPPGPAPAGFVRIPPGTFVMGSPLTEKEREDVETPHTVTLTKYFYMSKYEVTQREYLAVMGNNPSYFTTRDWDGNPISPDLNRPVERVSWNDATNYCGKLTASERAAGRLPAWWEYRLPTEAEWEYACRAGTSTAFHYGPDLRSGMANFDGHYEYVGATGTVTNLNGTYLARTTAVGSYQPKGFGLYDMHGNVYEWCLDWWYDSFPWYVSDPGGGVTDPKGPRSGFWRTFRGGSWRYGARVCRSAQRALNAPIVSGDPGIGFRPVLDPAQP